MSARDRMTVTEFGKHTNDYMQSNFVTTRIVLQFLHNKTLTKIYHSCHDKFQYLSGTKLYLLVVCTVTIYKRRIL